MDLELAGRGVLITGAAGSIGRGIALGFSREGARVFLLDLRQAPLEELCAGIRSAGGEAGCRAADVTREEQVAGAVEAALELFGGRIDVAVNAAGVLVQSAVEQLAPEDWDRAFAVNCRGTFLVTRAVVPVMKRAGWGRIINFSSKSGKTGSPLLSAYSAAKAAVIGFTQSLAHELGEHGITVNCVCPGIVEESGLWGELLEGYTRSLGIDRGQVAQRFSGKVPLKRLARVQDVVGVTLFLASPAAGYLTGQGINVSGGREMH
jgi:NAD(P)-dependent dehydrogenase (short-subunit alcohol dehydrogenase family)